MLAKEKMRSRQNTKPRSSRKDRKAKDHEKGAVLILALLVSVTMLLVAIPFMMKLSGQYRSTNTTHNSFVAMNLSEAGVERVIWELNYGDILPWEGDETERTATFSSVQTAGGDVVGDISVIVYNPDSDNPIIESTGLFHLNDSNTLTRTTRVVLQRRSMTPLFNSGVFGEDSVILGQNFILDGNVQTNGIQPGAIYVGNNTTVTGDAICGVGGDPEIAIDVNTTGQVLGEEKAAEAAKELPVVEVPDGLASQGGFLSSLPMNLSASNSGEYSSFVAEPGAFLTVTEDVTIHVTGEFNMRENTGIQIAEGASLTLYVSGTFILDSNCDMNNESQDATRLIIIGTDDFTASVTFDSNNAMYAAVYMPNADIEISSNIDFYGSIIGENMIVNQNVYVGYEDELADLGNFQGPEFFVLSWQEKFN